MMRDYKNEKNIPKYSGEIMNLDMSKVEPCLSGPKRPHDKVLMSEMQKDFNKCLPNKNGFKGFEVAPQDIQKTVKITTKGKE
jgi:aconitate hydratase